MASAYVGGAAIDTTSTFPQDITDDTDSKTGTPRTGAAGFLAQLLRDLGDAVIEIETELGLTPSGSFADVATRLQSRQTCRKTGDQPFTTQTPANVTDLSLVLAANTDYDFEFVLHDNGGTARGVGYGLTFSGTTTRLTARVNIGGSTAPGTSSTDASAEGTIQASGGVVTTAARNATSNFITIIRGIIQVGASGGTLQLQARQGTGTTAANMNVLKGSKGWAEAG